MLPSAALAKEPTAATIEGPCLDRPLTISSPLRHAGHSQLDRLTAAGGVAAAMFGHRVEIGLPDDPPNEPSAVEDGKSG